MYIDRRYQSLRRDFVGPQTRVDQDLGLGLGVAQGAEGAEGAVDPFRSHDSGDIGRRAHLAVGKHVEGVTELEGV